MWDFSINNYDSVWATVLQLLLLMSFFVIGNILRKLIPILKKSYIPSSLIGGLLLAIVNVIAKYVFGVTDFIDQDLMKIITYHALAIGFIAMSLKINKKPKQDHMGRYGVQNGLITGAVYMLQGVFGILTVLIFYWAGKNIFYDAGIILPLSFGQGPGNALTWDMNFSNIEHMTKLGAEGIMDTEGSFGLALASIGFIVASVVGVIYINVFRVKGEVKQNDYDEEIELASDNEITKKSASLTIQVALISISYLITFGIMMLLSFSNFTSSIAWGFNFIFGVVSANIVKLIYNLLRKKNICKQEYINNRQMSKISDFSFDLMIIAGVAAIDFNEIKDYFWVILALTIVGTIVTFVYVRIMTRKLFKGFEHDMFLVNFGTLTGTASNGMILLRESDPTFSRDSASIFVVSQLPAMVTVAPLLLLLNYSAKSVTTSLIAMGIFAALAIIYTIANILLIKKQK